MDNRDIKVLRAVYKYLDENNKFFNYLFFFNKLTHGFWCRTMRRLSFFYVILVIGLYASTLFVEEFPEILAEFMGFAFSNLWLWIIALIVYFILRYCRGVLDEVQAEDTLEHHTEKMRNTLRLNDAYWKKRYVNKMFKLVSSGKAGSIEEAAKKLNLRNTKSKLERYYADRDKALARYNEKAQDAQRERQKEQRKMREKRQFYSDLADTLGVFSEMMIRSSERGSSSGGSSSYSSSDDSGGYRRGSSASSKPDNSEQKREYESESDYWRSEYNRLRNEGVTGDKLNTAEYNMNYFARKAKELDN